MKCKSDREKILLIREEGVVREAQEVVRCDVFNTQPQCTPPALEAHKKLHEDGAGSGRR